MRKPDTLAGYGKGRAVREKLPDAKIHTLIGEQEPEVLSLRLKMNSYL